MFPYDLDSLRLVAKKSQQFISSVAVCLTCCACAWQICICFQKYLDEPVGTEIKVTLWNNVSMPAVYLCPYAGEEMTKIFHDKCATNDECEESYVKNKFPLRRLNLTVRDLWRNNSVQFGARLINCKYAMNEKLCAKNNFGFFDTSNGMHLDSVHGRCRILYKRGISWHYVGSNPLLAFLLTSVYFKGTKYPVPTTISLNNVPFVDKYIIAHHKLNWNEANFLHITSIKEFRRLNPCTRHYKYIDCINKCIDGHILRNNTNNCTLPFLGLKNQNCDTFDDVTESFYSSLWFSLQFVRTNCNCQSPCELIVYTSNLIRDTNYQNEFVNYLVLQVSFSSNIKEVITEFHWYTLSDFFTEMAGNLSFFLGISLLSAVQLLNCIST